ncbi:hypothetical protein CJJ09_005364 [Candidozyma auris]|nr:hypothetical protein CJJ09_005364 [[Candida] auris]
MILLTVFFLMSIIRNFEYMYHKLYLRLLSITYYPNKSPVVIRNDVNNLAKIPSISAVLSGVLWRAHPAFTLKVPHSNKTVLCGTEVEGQPTLLISLLSRVDGKPTIVELTKTMCDLTANNDLSVKDITVQLIDEELNELVGPEPDLLICFDPVLNLHDYPPWHLRLSEFYWEPDNDSVNYPVFIRALRQFSNCKMNVGK